MKFILVQCTIKLIKGVNSGIAVYLAEILIKMIQTECYAICKPNHLDLIYLILHERTIQSRSTTVDCWWVKEQSVTNTHTQVRCLLTWAVWGICCLWISLEISCQPSHHSAQCRWSLSSYSCRSWQISDCCRISHLRRENKMEDDSWFFSHLQQTSTTLMLKIKYQNQKSKSNNLILAKMLIILLFQRIQTLWTTWGRKEGCTPFFPPLWDAPQNGSLWKLLQESWHCRKSILITWRQKPSSFLPSMMAAAMFHDFYR